MRELAEAVVAACGSGSEIHFVDRPTDDPQVRRPDPTLAEQALGWRATTDPQTGLTRTVAWYRDGHADPAITIQDDTARSTT